jgi:hypothetical protein
MRDLILNQIAPGSVLRTAAMSSKGVVRLGARSADERAAIAA